MPRSLLGPSARQDWFDKWMALYCPPIATSGVLRPHKELLTQPLSTRWPSAHSLSCTAMRGLVMPPHPGRADYRLGVAAGGAPLFDVLIFYGCVATGLMGRRMTNVPFPR